MSKDRLNSMVNDENSQEIQRLKEENDQLKSALQHQSKQSVASKKSSQEPRFF
jgi:cell shape-determining protein MreC